VHVSKVRSSWAKTNVEWNRSTTTSRYLTAAQAALARQQVEAGHHFRAHVEAYWRACEGWADADLDAAAAAPAAEGVEKGGAVRRLPRKSRPRSGRS
jgi:hypothetical protein